MPSILLLLLIKITKDFGTHTVESWISKLNYGKDTRYCHDLLLPKSVLNQDFTVIFFMYSMNPRHPTSGLKKRWASRGRALRYLFSKIMALCSTWLKVKSIHHFYQSVMSCHFFYVSMNELLYFLFWHSMIRQKYIWEIYFDTLFNKCKNTFKRVYETHTFIQLEETFP